MGQGLLNMDPDLSMQLGLGLLAAGGKNLAGQGNVGSELQGAMGNYYAQKKAKQDLAQGQLQQQMLAARAGLMQQLSSQYLGNGQQPAATPQSIPQPMMGGGAPGAMASQGRPMQPPGMSAAPGPSQALQQPAPQWLNPPSPDQVRSMPIGGISPNYYRGMAIIDGKDPLTSDKEIEDRQRAGLQESYAPTLGKLQTIIKSDKPAQYVKADASLLQAWTMFAPQMGIDPNNPKDFTDQNVRTALTIAHNGLASSIGSPALAPIVPKTHSAGRLGSVMETDPVSNETKQVVSPEDLKEVNGPNGPTYVRGSQAEGRSAFNPTIFGASQMTDPAMELAYQEFKQTGKMPTGYAKNPVMNAKMTDYIAQRAKTEGVSVGDAMGAGQDLRATGEVVNEFNSTKPSTAGGKLIAINTAVSHLHALLPLIDAMETGDIKLINKAQNAYKTQTGKPAPTNYALMSHLAAEEAANAVMPGGGTGPERDAVTKPFDGANGPDVLRGAVKTVVPALAGKTDSLRQRWDTATMGRHGSFNTKFLNADTRNALGIQDDGGVHPDISAAAAAELARRGHN